MLLERSEYRINLKTIPVGIGDLMHRYIRHFFIVMMLIFSCNLHAQKISRDTFAQIIYSHHAATAVVSGLAHYDFYLGSMDECSFELSYEQHLAYALWLCSLGLLLSIALVFKMKKAWNSFYDFLNKYLSNKIPDRYILYHSLRLYC